MEAFDISYMELFFIVVIVFFSSFISSATGMAGGVLMFSMLNSFIPFRPLIAIHGSVQLVNNFSRSLLLLKDVKKKACLSFLAGAVIGTGFTTLFILELVDKKVPLIILLVFIIYTLFKPKKIPDFTISDAQFFWVGIGTGGLGMLAGAIEPFLALFFMRDDYTKEEIVANKSVMQFFVHATKIPAFLYLGFAFKEHILLIALFSIFAILGSKVGVLALYKISEKVFFKIMWLALFFSGVHILFKIIE